jgi:hypothetical protein
MAKNLINLQQTYSDGVYNDEENGLEGKWNIKPK